MLESKYLNYKQLKELKNQIELVGSVGLNDELNDFLEMDTDRHNGEYLCNIFSTHSMIELKELKPYIKI